MFDVKQFDFNPSGVEPSGLRVTVLGGGSFGTAIANLAVKNGCDTMIWIRDEQVAREINQTHVNIYPILS